MFLNLSGPRNLSHDFGRRVIPMRWPTTGQRPDQARNRLGNCSRDTRRAQQGKDAKLISVRLGHDQAGMVPRMRECSSDTYCLHHFLSERFGTRTEVGLTAASAIV